MFHPNSSMNLQAEVEKIKREIENQDLEWLEEMSKHARCVLLPSPDELITASNQGSDETGTLKDFQSVFKWVKESELLNDHFFEFYSAEGQLEKGCYNGLVTFAFNTGFCAMRNTHAATRDELLFYYYAGHGLDQKNARELSYSAAPVLNFRESSFKDASPYIGKNREVKGGELCLHNFGFCDFEGLIEPFIAAIKSKSINSKSNDEKKNKHLVMVLDSCHSGQFAEDLTKFVEEKQKDKQDWLNEGCTVTVQASCGKDEKAVGGYFTPAFIYLNDPNNKNVLDKLKGDWAEMKEDEKAKFKDLPFSSPVVQTTRNAPDSPTLEIEIQNIKMTLFQDPGFFKYCHHEIFGPLKDTLNLEASRVSIQDSARDFLKNKQFTVRDFKLKTFSTNGPFKGQLMGLFLLEDPVLKLEKLAICAHVHFAEHGTSKVGRINLVHHRYEPNSLLVFDYEREYVTDLSKGKVKKGQHKIQVAMVPNCKNADEKNPKDWVAWRWERNPDQSFHELAKAELAKAELAKADELAKAELINDMCEEVENAMELVTKCHDFVESKCPRWWSDLTQWCKTKDDPSYLCLFRTKQRSVSMGKYLEQIKDYDLPKVVVSSSSSSGQLSLS